LKEFSLDYIRCVKCYSRLELEVFLNLKEIEEGMLECKKCNSLYPIIEKIPFLWNDFSDYLSSHRTLGGKLFNSSSGRMKNFIKKSLTAKTPKIEDRTDLEIRWTSIYQNNNRSGFYSTIKNELEKLPTSKLSLEYGCSIGTITDFLADSSKISFGVDGSFSALKIAQNESKDNLDYFVADLISTPFGTKKFDLIVALNLLELVEPTDFLNHVSEQIDKGCLILSDPYDYDRGKNSVKNQLDEKSLRKNLKNLGFKILKNTIEPSKIPWNLKLYARATLNYKVDLIIAKK